MKTLVLVDGTTYEVLDDSNIANIRIPVEDFADADEIETKFTKENLTLVRLGYQEFHQVNLLGISVMKNDDGFVCTVTCQESIQDYVDNVIDNVIERLIEEGVIE